MKYKLLKLVCASMRTECNEICGYTDEGFFCPQCEQIVDQLLAAGVTLPSPKEPRPEPDLTGKCGGCAYSAPATVFGGSKCYVECTNKAHTHRHCDKRGPYTAVRARTAKGCKRYTPKEG